MQEKSEFEFHARRGGYVLLSTISLVFLVLVVSTLFLQDSSLGMSITAILFLLPVAVYLTKSALCPPLVMRLSGSEFYVLGGYTFDRDNILSARIVSFVDRMEPFRFLEICFIHTPNLPRYKRTLLWMDTMLGAFVSESVYKRPSKPRLFLSIATCLPPDEEINRCLAASFSSSPSKSS